MPALIERRRKLDEPDAWRVERLGLMQDVAERIDPLFAYRKRDFLEARSTIGGGMEPDDFHARTSSTKGVLAENDDMRAIALQLFFPN